MVHIFIYYTTLLSSFKALSLLFGVGVHYTICMSYGCIICTNIIQVPKAQILAQPKPEGARPKFTFGLSRAMWFRVWLDPSFTHTVGLASKRNPKQNYPLDIKVLYWIISFIWLFIH